MPQNRKGLIDLFIGNLSNVIVHEIMGEATESEEIASYYKKEVENSLKISRKYRSRINPINTTLPEKDIEYIKKKLVNRVKSKLRERIFNGYKNISLNLVEKLVNKTLESTNVK
jgi:hypothetical protein